MTPSRKTHRPRRPGTVVALDTVAGEVVASGAPLLTIVDTRTMWALLAVPERLQARLAPGQPVVLTVQGGPLVVGSIEEMIREAHARAEDARVSVLCFIGGFALFALVSTYLDG